MQTPSYALGNGGQWGTAAVPFPPSPSTQLAWNSTPVVKEHRGDSTSFQAFDEVLQAPSSAYVLPSAPVYITVGATAFADAASEYDTVDVDFASHDPEKYLLIESIDISLHPAT